jgi:hypothetical protein
MRTAGRGSGASIKGLGEGDSGRVQGRTNRHRKWSSHGRKKMVRQAGSTKMPSDLDWMTS